MFYLFNQFSKTELWNEKGIYIVDLLKYVQDICMQEKILYTYNQIILEIDQEIKHLQNMYNDPARYYKFYKNFKSQYDIISSKYHYEIEYNMQKPQVINECEKPKEISSFSIIFGLVILFILTIIGSPYEAGCFIVLLYLFVVFLPICITHWNANKVYKDKLKKYNEYQHYLVKEKEYQENENIKNKNSVNRKAHEAEVAHMTEEYLDSIKNDIDYYQYQRSIVENSKNQIVISLEKMYSSNIIYKKYRSIVPMFMICEYLESNRCTKLEGHDGAYNMYEQELRANIIIDRLDIIIYKLDE